MKLETLQKFKRIINSWYFIPLILLLLGTIFFPLVRIQISPDSIWYLEKATDIYNNFELKKLMTQRSGFILMLVGMLHTFGYSVQTAFYVVRLFFLLNILLAYFIGTKLFNRATGLTFSLLIFTSFIINTSSSRLLLDNILPFFILLYIFLSYLALERSKYLYFIFSGLTIGFAVLVKGVIAVMFIPLLPICLLIFKKYRTLKNIKGLGLTCLSFIFILSPWIYYIIFDKGTLEILIGVLADGAKIKNFGLTPSIGENSLTSIGGTILKQLEDFKNFAIKYIGGKFSLWPLFLLGIIYSLYQVFLRKKRALSFLLLSIILFLPIIYVTNKVSLREGQLVILYFLLYLIAANLLINFPKKITNWRIFKSNKFRYKNLFLNIFIILIVSICLFSQIFIGTTKKRAFYYGLIKDRERYYSFSLWKSKTILSGKLNNTIQETAKWIEANMPPYTYVVSSYHSSHALRLLTKNKYIFPGLAPMSTNSDVVDKIAERVKKENLKPLFFCLDGTNLHPIGHTISIIFEAPLLKNINDSHGNYVIISSVRNFTSLYFENNPNFSLTETFGDGDVKIYKVNKYPVQPRTDDFSPRFDERIYTYLNRLYHEVPDKYNEHKQNFKKVVQWSDKEEETFFSFIEEDDKAGFWENYKKVKILTIY